ncbi:MAG TPA: zinc ABC transporter substrate-binding protein ZnuA [Afifellaceae bacterium]|nr:zinc ABC transporter substrate-binding protein ZnuA [Afifellaceae bacterium]
MRRLPSLFAAPALLALSAFPTLAASDVIASIKPLHSLVAGVMDGVAEPGLLIDGAGSPHAYSLRPSQARALEQADVIFWVGHELETFLEKPIATLGADAQAVSLAESDGIELLPYREDGEFGGHDHEAEGDHDEHAESGHGHANEHEAMDMHIWLDPENAKAMVDTIRLALTNTDPANADRYDANAAALTEKLERLAAELETELAPVKDRPFVVFHDGYHYFENRFGMEAAGAITVNPEVAPGAERLSEIRDRLQGLRAACVFAEPQFEPKLVSVVIEGTGARSAVLDPLGASIDAGPDLYFDLMRQMGESFRHCLDPNG